MRSRIVALLALLVAVSSPSMVPAQKKPAIVVEIPFERIRDLLPKDGEPIAIWKAGMPGVKAPRRAWPRDEHPEQQTEYAEIAFGRFIRSHPNDRNDRDQLWVRPGIIARDGCFEIKAGWRVKIDGKPGSPHYDGTIRAKLRFKMDKGKVIASLDDLKVTHKGSNVFITFANIFGANIDVAGMVKKAIETEATKALESLNEKIDKVVKDQPKLKEARGQISIDIISAPPLVPPKEGDLFGKVRFAVGLADQPGAKLGVVRVSVYAP